MEHKKELQNIVLNEIQKRNINLYPDIEFLYNKFDFGSKKCNIFLSIEKSYNNKSLIKMIELKIRNANKIAKEKDFNHYHIWENEIIEGNFSILNKIKQENECV